MNSRKKPFLLIFNILICWPSEFDVGFLQLFFCSKIRCRRVPDHCSLCCTEKLPIAVTVLSHSSSTRWKCSQHQKCWLTNNFIYAAKHVIPSWLFIFREVFKSMMKCLWSRCDSWAERNVSADWRLHMLLTLWLKHGCILGTRYQTGNTQSCQFSLWPIKVLQIKKIPMWPKFFPKRLEYKNKIKT